MPDAGRVGVVPRVITGVGVALLVSVLVVACNGGGEKADPDDGTGVNAACTLLTREDVGAALGTPVEEGEGSGGNACRFDLAGSPDQAVVLLKMTDPSNRAAFERALAETKDAANLPGVGERAFITGDHAYVLKGDTIAVVLVNLQRPAPALADAVTKLAQVMAPRL